MPWTYPPELADALLGFGLRPTPATPPLVVRDALNDLYRYELRRMRDQLRAGNIPKADYIDSGHRHPEALLAAHAAAARVGRNLPYLMGTPHAGPDGAARYCCPTGARTARPGRAAVTWPASTTTSPPTMT